MGVRLFALRLSDGVRYITYKSRTVELKEPQHINYSNYNYGEQDIDLAKKATIRTYQTKQQIQTKGEI